MCYNNFWFWPFFFLCFGRTPVPTGNKNLNSGESPQFEKGSRNLYYVLRRLQPFRLNFRAELCFSNQPPLKLQVPKHCQDEDHVCQITLQPCCYEVILQPFFFFLFRRRSSIGGSHWSHGECFSRRLSGFGACARACHGNGTSSFTCALFSGRRALITFSRGGFASPPAASWEVPAPTPGPTHQYLPTATSTTPSHSLHRTHHIAATILRLGFSLDVSRPGIF